MPRCPSCVVPLTRVEDPNDIRLATCPSCFGTWISAVALTRLTRLDARIQPDSSAAASPTSLDDTTIHELAATVAESNTIDSLRCPQCEKPMVKDRFHPMIPVTIDRCNHCGFIWLDAGELGLIRKLNHELMTSNDPEIARRREKVAAVAAQWDAHLAAEPTLAGLRAPSIGGISGAGVQAFDLLSYMLSR